MGNSSIEWTDKTWNPTRGCSRVSEGCRNCYAERQAARFAGPMVPYADPPLEGLKLATPPPFEGFVQIANGHPQWTGKVELIESKLIEPLRWRKPQRVFVNSMSDLFHEALPDEALDRVFAVMALCPQHTFQCLTKRSARMLEYIHAEPKTNGRAVIALGGGLTRQELIDEAAGEWACHANLDAQGRWPLPNVWLGVSVEDRKNKDRIDILRDTPAAVRFLSIEPLLEDIGSLDLQGIDWVIVGGESGPGARPFDIAWARNVIAQCNAGGVPCFVKQVGTKPIFTWDPEKDAAPRLHDRKGGDPDEWPADLRIRQFPKATS